MFVKPVKSYFSIFANQVNNNGELIRVVKSCLPSAAYLAPLNWFLAHYSSFELTADYLLAESLLHGDQITLEGYDFNDKVEIIGIVDSIMYPGTISFERFDYPSKLSTTVQDAMISIANDYIKGIKLNNTLFNIEMMYNPKTNEIHIIEVNPRMSSQFADLFEKVDGINTYQILLDIALGVKPKFMQKQGKYKTAASFVLRRFENNQVIKTPTIEQITQVSEKFPDSRIELFAIEGQDLCAFKQDGKSFRYGLIHLGAQNKQELFQKFEQCKQNLPIQFNEPPCN
ncbi:MAG: acetyl-CoA carboxylase biotin carboxylase subunit family protein [Candidatus Berkiella sp.]